MAKRRYSFDDDKLARFQNEGRGLGEGADYRPWLTIHDVPSTGRCSRIHCRKTGREHHLLSDIETALFYILDWSDSVTDIREQFPLDRDVTRKIATEMGVRHPRDTSSKIDIVMTTDFLVSQQINGKSRLLARSVKPSDELDDARVLEKQEIERRYWQTKGTDWGLVIKQDLPKQRIHNLSWLHEMQSLLHMTEPYAGYWEERCIRFLTFLPKAREISIRKFIRLLENEHSFCTGEGLTILRHLAANKRIRIDLDSKFDMQMPIESLAALAKPTSNSTFQKIA